MTYDWLAILIFLAIAFVATAVGRFFVFRVPALERMRQLNREANRSKLARKSFRAAVKRNNLAGLVTNVVLVVGVLPWFLSLEPRPLWRHLVDILVVLMVYDFAYYLTHRFLFHGKILRKIHALHHQARTPTHIDALYVHPLETAIGLVLFMGSIPLVSVLSGGPLSAISMAVATIVFTQVNQINHTYVNLPYFPFKTLDYITSIHAAHHVDMNQGNYATLTMLYDWMFRTLEDPVSRSTP